MTQDVRPAYPLWRMVFQVCFLMFTGTIYAFSAWSEAFTRLFPQWSSADLGFIYSMGIFGAFATPLGGLIYDRVGASRTYLIGLAMLLAGVSGMMFVIALDIDPQTSLYSIAGFYYLEEQGSSTLYMAVALDTLNGFPPASTAFSMGLVAMGYSLSSIFATWIVGHMEVGICTLFFAIAVVLSMFTTWRVCVLGDVLLGTQSLQQETDKSPTDYHSAFASPAFVRLIALTVTCFAPCTVLLGFTKALGDAGGVSGIALAQCALIANGAGRPVGGMLYDQCRRLPACWALFTLACGISVSWAFLFAHAEGHFGGRCLWFATLMALFLFGAHTPVLGAYVKDYFSSKLSGFILGVQPLSVAVGNYVFTAFCGPTSTAHDKDFIKTMRAALGLSVVGCVAVLPGLIMHREVKTN